MGLENDANVANDTELAAHIALASARAKAAMPGATETLQDLEDYYERALQIRMMTVDTLKEAGREASARSMSTIRRWKTISALLCGVVIAVTAAYAPGVVDHFISEAGPYFTGDRVLSHSAVCVVMYVLFCRTPTARTFVD
jgi:hypothetical protein